MKLCALALAVDGTEDGLISCFKEGGKIEAGRALLESKMRLSLIINFTKILLKTQHHSLT